jgi:hypothetical protein
MTAHCSECGSRLCNHGNCPECNPCKHCDGGDRMDKQFDGDDLPVDCNDSDPRIGFEED